MPNKRGEILRRPTDGRDGFSPLRGETKVFIFLFSLSCWETLFFKELRKEKRNQKEKRERGSSQGPRSRDAPGTLQCSHPPVVAEAGCVREGSQRVTAAAVTFPAGRVRRLAAPLRLCCRRARGASSPRKVKQCFLPRGSVIPEGQQALRNVSEVASLTCLKCRLEPTLQAAPSRSLSFLFGSVFLFSAL